jgi:hypothetical protein
MAGGGPAQPRGRGVSLRAKRRKAGGRRRRLTGDAGGPGGRRLTAGDAAVGKPPLSPLRQRFPTVVSSVSPVTKVWLGAGRQQVWSW